MALQHHSCALWQYHAIPAGAFSWTVMKSENGKKKKKDFLKTQQVLCGKLLFFFKTYLQCCTLALPCMVTFEESFCAHRETRQLRHLYCSGDVGESTADRCEWLMDRQPGCVCPPCGYAASVFLQSLLNDTQADVGKTAKQKPPPPPPLTETTITSWVTSRNCRGQ